MGTPQLTTYIKNQGYSGVNIQLKDMKSKTIAIDFSIWAYKANYARSTDNPHPMYAYFIKMIKNFIINEIKFIFVFDGTPPPLKKDTILSRDDQTNKYKEQFTKLKAEYELIVVGDDDIMRKINITNEMHKLNVKINIAPRKEEITYMKDLFTLMNIPHITIDEHDAEAFCGYLNKMGYIDYVLTSDSDGLIFGCNNIVYDYKHNDSTLRIKYLYHVLDLLKFPIDGTGLTKLINFAYCCGTDYNKHIYKRRIANDHCSIINSKNFGFDVIINNIKKSFKIEDVQTVYDNYLKIYDAFTFDYSKLFNDISPFDFSKKDFGNFVEGIRSSIKLLKDNDLLKNLSIEAVYLIKNI